jgi:hypothetical protein
MKKVFLFLVIVLVLSSVLFAAGEDKGFCPPPSKISKELRAQPAPTPNGPPPEADAKFAGVSLLIVISNKGYVCSAQVIRGFDKETGARAMQEVRHWRFHPSTKNGNPVTVEMRVEVGFWRKANGELVSASSGKPAK